ncbi:MAG: hypothetical protein HZB26_12325 [Candidatus Hydrogenedentes bacterium]|nr:hypothetical protein [Candidatus Hydrogenedentota bacterium]
MGRPIRMGMVARAKKKKWTPRRRCWKRRGVDRDTLLAALADVLGGANDEWSNPKCAQFGTAGETTSRRCVDSVT